MKNFLLALLLTTLTFFKVGCSSNCGNTILEEVSSPSGSFIATVFERNCGATTSFSRNVVLREKGKKFDGDNTVDLVFVMEGKYNVNVKWSANNALFISVPNRSVDIFKKRTSWKEVKITYES